MAQFIKQHPWDPKYALPAHVRAEPPGRGVIHTKGLRRRTISTFIPYNKQYAIPDYVLNEPPGRGVVYTNWLHRKTIPSLLPQYLGQVLDASEEQFEQYGREGAPLAVTLPAEVYALDGIGEMRMPKNDAIRKYGERVARLLLREIRNVSPDAREIAFEAILNELEPGLFDRVADRTEEYAQRGMPDEAAVKAALASSISEGFAKEIIKAGKTGTVLPSGLLGLGAYGVTSVALDGFFSKIRRVVTSPVRLVKKGVSRISSVICKGGRFVGVSTWTGIKGAGKGTWGAAKFVGKVPVTVTKKAVSAGKKVLKKVAGLGCKLISSTTGKLAAGGAAAAYGAPPQAGVAGADVAASICAGKVGAPPPVPVAPLMAVQARGIPWGPIAIGGAALLGVVLFVRR